MTTTPGDDKPTVPVLGERAAALAARRERGDGDHPTQRLDAAATEAFAEVSTTQLLPEAGKRGTAPWTPVLAGLGAGVVGAAIVVGALTVATGTPAPVTSSSGPPATAASATPEAPAEQPVDEQPAPVVAAPPRPQAGVNECVDALGDGGLDLDTASVARDDGDLVTRFTVATALPGGDSGLGIILANRNGQRAYQLGIALENGEPGRLFVVNLGNGDEDDLDVDDVRVDGSTVVAAFPDSVLRRMGDDWRWYAFATAEATALDACPGTEASPEWLTFSGGR